MPGPGDELLIPDTEADDVVLAGRDSRGWLAWSAASLEREEVRLASWQPGHAPAELPALAGFRPALAVTGAGAVCAHLAPDGSIVVRRLGEAAVEATWTVSPGGRCHRVAMASDDRSIWLAWESDHQIVVAALEATGPRELARLAGPDRWLRRPVLAARDGQLWIACVASTPAGAGEVQLAALGQPLTAVRPGRLAQDAPALLVADTGPIVAWHELAPADRGPVLRWPCVTDAASGARWDPPAITELPRARAGEDQGWEMPALARDAAGDLWLAGRSSHGWWAAHRRARDGAWSERLPLSRGDWGGRGTSAATAVLAGHVWLARRDPDGLRVTPLAVPTRHEAATPAEAPTRARVRARRSVSGPLFGDLHRHSAHSDGCGTAEDLWIDARARGLDFAALTDHDRFCRRAIGPSTWQYMTQLADAFDEPGEMAALAAYEFTGPRHPGPGHKCVYFGDDRPDRIPDKDVDAVFAAARAHGGIAVPHHVGWTGADTQHHDPAVQPVWEIFSVHGCYECCGSPTAFPPRQDPALPGHFVCDALRAGLRFGFIASTDSHGLLWHHGIGPKRDPFSSGLAGLVGAERTRASVLAALRERRCYATTGARIAVRVDLDGATMGAELPADARGSLRVDIEGTAAVASAVLVEPHRERPIPLTKRDSSARGCIDVERGERDWTFCYVRITQEDGEQAWTSPIWIG